jgi:salicylate hydroxylase
MTMSELTIIGGGIAGLTCALSLQRQGVKVRLFEQASQFEEVGAGLTLSQPASRGLFSLGLREAIEEMADIPASARAADYMTGEGISIPDRMKESREKGDLPYFYQIHRADMHNILADAVMANDPETITLGARFEKLLQHDDGVTATFDSGLKVHSKILIGADGINSRVRRELFGEEEPRFTGQVAYRFLVPVEQVEEYMQIGPSVNYVGPGRHLLRYVLRHGTLVNGVAFVQTDIWTGEGWSTPAESGEMLEKFKDWNDDVKGLLRNAPLNGTRKWALFDREPLPKWTVGRVTMMGDSAHPMLPFLGLGAAMGIEDAVVFGRAWSENEDKEQALKIYEETRRERANYVLLASRRQGEINQAKDSDNAKRYTSKNEHLMEYDPSTVALAAV